MKNQERKRRYIVQLHGLERCEVGRLKLYRTVARDLASRAERASLTLSDLDLWAAICFQCPGLLGICPPIVRAVVMKILHQEQMKLDGHHRPNHQPAIPSRFAEVTCQSCSSRPNW